MSDKPRLPFALFDAALSGVQSAVHTVTGLAGAPFRRSDAPPDTPSPTPADDGFAPRADTATAPSALATALDERGRDALAAHAEGREPQVASGGSVVDRIPRADANPREPGAVEAHRDQPTPDEELGPKPFTPQVGR